GRPDHHSAVDRFPACQELGLGDDRPTAVGIPALAAALALRLQARRPLERGDLVAGASALVAVGPGTATTTTARGAAATLARVLGIRLGGTLLGIGVGLLGRL